METNTHTKKKSNKKKEESKSNNNQSADAFQGHIFSNWRRRSSNRKWLIRSFDTDPSVTKIIQLHNEN